MGRKPRAGAPDSGANGWRLARHQMPFRLRLQMASTHHAINRAVTQVRRLAKRCGCPADRQADLEIAVREALANAVDHGNGQGSKDKVFLRCYCGPEAGILIAVRDRGNGFDPDAVPDPRNADRMELAHGRGLLLMRELMDRMEYRRGGSEVILFQRLV